MTDEQLHEIMRRQAEGIRAMSQEEMARRQLEGAHGMQNAWSSGVAYMRRQADMTNLLRQTADNMPIAQLPPKPRKTLLERFMMWIQA